MLLAFGYNYTILFIDNILLIIKKTLISILSTIFFIKFLKRSILNYANRIGFAKFYKKIKKI